MRIRLDRISNFPFFRLLLVSCLLAFLLWGSTAVSVSQDTHFPTIQANTLNKTRLQLPQDFAGQLNLVIISFAREQQRVVDTWIPVVREIQPAHSKFSYYELQTMASENPLYRWWFDAALRNNTNDHALRSRILTAYINKHRFLTALHITDEKQVVVVLVDQTGKIYWRAEGTYSEQEKLSLLAVLAANKI